MCYQTLMHIKEANSGPPQNVGFDSSEPNAGNRLQYRALRVNTPSINAHVA